MTPLDDLSTCNLLTRILLFGRSFEQRPTCRNLRPKAARMWRWMRSLFLAWRAVAPPISEWFLTKNKKDVIPMSYIVAILSYKLVEWSLWVSYQDLVIFFLQKSLSHSKNKGMLQRKLNHMKTNWILCRTI